MDNYYDILEIEESASPETIKQAYRQLIQVWHPDRFQSNRELRLKAENKTKQITEAFRNLADPNLRRQHDLDLNRKRSSKPSKPHQDKPGNKTRPSIKILSCPNPGCGFMLRIPTKARLKVHCVNSACGTIFMYDPLLDAIWNVFIPDIDKHAARPTSHAGQSSSHSEQNSAYQAGEFMGRLYVEKVQPLIRAIPVWSRVAAVLIVVGTIYVSREENRTPKAVAPQETLQAWLSQPLPPNGEITRFHAGKPVAPLKIVTRSTDANYFVKLVDWTSGKTVITLFIRAGHTTETTVPLGSYKLRYAAGTQWYGTELLFGPDTSRYEADKRFDFSKRESAYSGYTVELFLRPHGNLHMRSMSKNEW